MHNSTAIDASHLHRILGLVWISVLCGESYLAALGAADGVSVRIEMAFLDEFSLQTPARVLLTGSRPLT
jgi:hypothetical protein